MFSIANIYRNINLNMYLLLHARFKSKTHWAKLRKKTGSKYKALSHFDDFYGSVFGEQWQPMREALFRRPKYVALINNYGDAEETMDYLKNRGAHCLKNLISVQQDFHEQYLPKTELSSDKSMQQSKDKLREYVAKVQTNEISMIYPQTDQMPERLDLDDVTLHKSYENKNIARENKPSKNLTLDESLAEAEIDESRIIDPSMGLTSEALYQYLPATKLKGMDEWVPESLHYSFYSQDKDFPLVIEPETQFEYPEHLKVYTYEMDSDYNMFPEPKRCQTGVLNYYPLDCGSVLAVLALCLSPGDRVLDLCAAPGGKSLVALQTLLPEVIVCNDMSISRCNRMRHIFRDYLFDFETSNRWRERVLMSRIDGRMFADDQGFDKVLVDVPCTTDRHSVNEDVNNIFRPDRIKERLRIPEMQSQLLANALKSVRVGGAVVYSTCSLSPIQNDGAVHMALRYAFETHGVLVAVKDLTPAWAGFSSTLQLATGQAAPRYGQLVLPSVGANFGPTYIARLAGVLHKKNSKLKVENYRPISILNTFGKVFERLVYESIYSVHKCIPHEQHGFLRGRSTLTNLSVFINFLHKSMEERKQVDLIYTDVQKAFDRVDHVILPRKLYNLGIYGDLLRWTESYLKNRSQAILTVIYLCVIYLFIYCKYDIVHNIHILVLCCT